VFCRNREVVRCALQDKATFEERLSAVARTQIQISLRGLIVIKMKFELVDAVVILVALFMLAAYMKLQNIVFVYVFILLIAAEIFVQVRHGKKQEVKESASLP